MKSTYFFSNNVCCLNIHKKLLNLKGTDFGWQQREKYYIFFSVCFELLCQKLAAKFTGK